MIYQRYENPVWEASLRLPKEGEASETALAIIERYSDRIITIDPDNKLTLDAYHPPDPDIVDESEKAWGVARLNPWDVRGSPTNENYRGHLPS